MKGENTTTNSQNVPYKKYDYIFCGAGASTCLLVRELHNNKLLRNKRVLLIDKETKQKNDKSFCFWSEKNEQITVDLSDIISTSWDKTIINGEKTDLGSLSYHYIQSSDLYKSVEILGQKHGWERHIGNIDDIYCDRDTTYVASGKNTFVGEQVFDSRTPKYIPDENPHLLQSFIGWFIKLEDTSIDPSGFNMMDFNTPQDGAVQFIYVLPFSPSQLLVELTRFGTDHIDTKRAHEILEIYITKKYGRYTLLENETGCIPMSQRSIYTTIIPRVINIGSRNYNIKASTGYAFKNMYLQAQNISSSLLHLAPSNKKSFIVKTRFRLYDGLLLDIIEHHPYLGKDIFTRLFKIGDTQKILHFLEEKTSLSEEIQIFYQLPWRPFLRALGKKILSSAYFQPLFLTALTLTLIFLGQNSSVQNLVGLSLLILGLIITGIPHGAVDHLLESGKWNHKKGFVFIGSYLGLGAMMGFLWMLSPDIALIIFILYSMWHFGEADGKIWNFGSPISFLWGFSVLAYILGTHREETNSILEILGSGAFPLDIPVWALLPWFIYAGITHKYTLIMTLIWLTLGSQIPLIFAFGMYFIGQHSLIGWKHLKQYLHMSHSSIWLQSLPFHLGAWVLLVCFYMFWPMGSEDTPQKWAIFFIFLACISFPHVIHMHLMYRKNR